LPELVEGNIQIGTRRVNIAISCLNQDFQEEKIFKMKIKIFWCFSSGKS